MPGGLDSAGNDTAYFNKDYSDYEAGIFNWLKKKYMIY